MRRSDLYMIFVVVAMVLPFVLSSELFSQYKEVNATHPLLMAFLKFGVLATIGEMIGLRIKTGSYTERGFGAWSRFVVWGVLGVWIAIAMKCFSVGAPVIAELIGFDGVVEAMKGDLSWQKVVGSLSISLMMNSLFAPIFMTIHRITDTHIMNHDGSIRSLVTPIPFGKYLSQLNWKVQWEFVIKKTIPFFWLPAHTITFLLPVDYQVLFAALLGVALGVILSVAAVMSRK